MYPFYEKKNQKLQIDLTEDMQFPAHLHSDIEFFFVLEGTACLEVKNKRQTLRAGECALIFPEEIHRYASQEKNKGLMIIFHQAAAGPFLRFFQKFSPEDPFLTLDRIPADVALAVRRLTDDTVRSDFLLSTAWIQVILANLFPLLTLKEQTVGEETDLAFRTIQYVAKHFQEPLTLELLAKKLHVNKYYLSHTISDRLQMNFREYLNEIRLDYAMHLIQSSGLSLTQIWGESGFESQTSFNRVFRKKMNMTPREYRNSLLL
ncbi:MAG: AraC family transcriptional regulator [Clostridiales bacterium]|nr:AraC family transcriptional regulator [Clostridiales bacterium]